MNKKLILLIISISIFLLISVNSISASSDISVKVVWDDSSQIERPNEITVNLLDNGEIVDTVKLNAENSWKATFNVDLDDGNYEVKTAKIDKYSSKITGNAENGFVITNKIIAENELLGSADSDNNDTLANPISEDVVGANETDSNTTDNETDSDNNSTTDNETDENVNSTVTKKADKKTSSSPAKKTSDVKKHAKKKTNTTTTKMKKTGLPIVVLVLIMFVTAFVPFSRRK